MLRSVNSKTTAVALVASMGALFGVAHAQSWNEKVQMCAAAAQEEGIIDLETYEPRFKKGSDRRISIALAPKRAGDVVKVECKISRGEVTSVVTK